MNKMGRPSTNEKVDKTPPMVAIPFGESMLDNPGFWDSPGKQEPKIVVPEGFRPKLTHDRPKKQSRPKRENAQILRATARSMAKKRKADEIARENEFWKQVVLANREAVAVRSFEEKLRRERKALELEAIRKTNS